MAHTAYKTLGEQGNFFLYLQDVLHASSRTLSFCNMRPLLGYPTKIAHTILEKTKQLKDKLEATN